jgi:PPOX class probable F420-dependent enzyme
MPPEAERTQRASIAMAPDEVDRFLRGRHTMALATTGPSGRPHLVAMWYGFVDGAPGFLTYRGSQKYMNLVRNPEVTCLVEDGDVYEELRGVQLLGRAEAIGDEDLRLELAYSVTERYQGPLDGDGRTVVRERMAKRLAVRIDVERVVSWDHRKLVRGDGVRDR